MSRYYKLVELPKLQTQTTHPLDKGCSPEMSTAIEDSNKKIQAKDNIYVDKNTTTHF